MSKKRCSVLICCACLALCASCVKKETPAETYAVPDYRGWKQPVPIVSGIDFPEHVGTVRRIYANDTAYESRTETDAAGYRYRIMKPGSVVVKETYSSLEDLENNTPRFVTIMEKSPSHPHAQNGWLFVRQLKGVGPGEYVDGRYCSGCHEAANESHPYFDGNPDDIFRDYIFINMDSQ